MADKDKARREAEEAAQAQREREAREEMERQEDEQRQKEEEQKALQAEARAARGDESDADRAKREAREKRQADQARRAEAKGKQRSVRDAANEIRADIAAPPANAHHWSGFAEKVCRELGMDVTPINVARVIHSLQEKGIEPEFAEYPKYVGGDERTGAGGMLVRSEDEERQYLDALDGDPEAADRMRADREGEIRGGGVTSAANSINPLRDRPAYEPGALPGEPGGQDGPEASPVRLGTDKSAAPPQTIEPVHNEPNKRQDIDTAHGLNDASRSRTDSPEKPANEGNPEQPFPKVQMDQQNRAERLQDKANG